MSAEHDCRTRPFITIVQMPQTCSRQFICQTGGVVRSPALFTGFFWISIRHEMMLRFGRYGISNCSQYCGESGLARRRMWISTDFRGDDMKFIFPHAKTQRRKESRKEKLTFLRFAVVAFAWLDQTNIDRFVREDGTLA